METEPMEGRAWTLPATFEATSILQGRWHLYFYVPKGLLPAEVVRASASTLKCWAWPK